MSVGRERGLDREAVECQWEGGRSSERTREGRGPRAPGRERDQTRVHLGAAAMRGALGFAMPSVIAKQSKTFSFF